MGRMMIVLLLALSNGALAQEELRFLMRGTDLAITPPVVPAAAAAINGQKGSAPSPGLSFLLSALVPGAGQIYQGRSMGWAFVATDAALWAGFAMLRNDGSDMQRSYRRFADEHYELTNPEYGNDAERGWHEWWEFFRIIDPSFIWADSVYWRDIRDAYERDRTRYYQDIEASNAYIFGWEDWAPHEFGNGDYWWQDADGLHFSFVSPLRDEYRGMRAKADSRLRWASRLVGVALLARAATAIEALRSARVVRQEGLAVSVDWSRPEPAL
ncbi:hypothetical protein JXA88_04405, partial [Candidatus Fermentibacteria bacterium]|nr:hypothetical protein [Candidatus Fermentibacteria bacterium]